MMLQAASFSGAQITLIAVVSVICVALFAANAVLLCLFFYKRKRKKLCTAALQERREKLLEELYALRVNPPVETAADEAIEESGEDADVEEVTADGTTFRTEILAVKDMTPLMREKFGFVGAEYDKKRYYVRSSYSFEAKLRSAKPETKDFYTELANEMNRYEKATLKRSFRQERFYFGRKTLALLLFRGKTLCIALALNPADYEETKYRGENVSEIKRFASVPMLIRITSERRKEYVKYLLGVIASENELEASELTYGTYDTKLKSRGALFAEELLKITILSEATDEEYDAFDSGEEETESGEISVTAPAVRVAVLPVAEMSDLMRRQFGLMGKEYSKKSYYVRYSYSFGAKLRQSGAEVRERYQEFVHEIDWYKNLNLKDGFRQQRIAYGRKTLGLLVFKGKTLCVALALNPNDYAETKYRGIDLSDVKRFAQTPLLIKLTSRRRLTYAKYLLNRLAEERLIELNEVPDERKFDFKPLSMAESFAAGELKIKIVGEATEDGAK